jgi:hypothetical protein
MWSKAAAEVEGAWYNLHRTDMIRVEESWCNREVILCEER